MRIFEILIIITAIASMINLFILKREKLNLVLSGISVLFIVLSVIFEGYRIHMVPAYLIVLILLIISVIKNFNETAKPKKLIRIPGIVLLILLLLISIAFPLIFPIVKLPAPEGKYSVGTTFMSFIDKSRKDMFSDKNAYRDIAVQIWYPADNTTGKETLNFFPEGKMSDYLAQSMSMPNIFNQVSLVKTHSYLNADLSDKVSKYPIILFSGGYLSFPGQNTVLMENLASQGYIVFSISHPYEYFATEYPNGKIVKFNSKQVNDLQNELVKLSKAYSGDTSGADFERYQATNAGISNQSIHIWSDDTKFVADEIERLDRGDIKSIFKNKLDTSEMGVFGHSFGGATAGQVCLGDSRFKAFVNLDGAPFGDSIKRTIKQPFMIINGDTHKELIEGGYSPEQKNYIDVTIKGAKHLDFTDFTLLLPAFKHLGILGNIDGNRQEKIIDDYVTSFFNVNLKGLNEPLINDGLNRYSGVTVEKR